MIEIQTSPAIRLLRLHQPTGIWLLFWPCAWGIALGSAHAETSQWILTAALFFIGAVVMRSAGCIVNDVWDRKLDAQVERTRMRPLASGEISLRRAAAILLALLCIAVVIWWQLNVITKFLSFVALVLVAAYPAMKRITWWPQAFLGVTFNFGILMGDAQMTGRVSLPALILYLGAVFWTIGYDTIYAHQDMADDRAAGIKSTALKFTTQPRRFTALCYAIPVLLWWVGAMTAGLHWPAYVGMLTVAAHLVWQLAEWRPDDGQNCARIFRANALTGALMAAALMAGAM